MNRSVFAVAAASAGAVFAADADAAVSYNKTAGETITSDFNGLPNDRSDNQSIEVVNSSDPNQVDYTDGWQDDVDYTTSPQDDVSVLGWHLYHPAAPASENGFNGHQRFRMGTGQNTGSFWGFANSNDLAEKALGSIGSTTVAANGANMYMGFHLTNGSGKTLNSFTVTYNGEEWRDGQGTTGETLSFDYSLDATDNNWAGQQAVGDPAAAFTAVPALNFTAPVVAGTGTSGTPVNGNVEGRVSDITATISGINWAPGTDLWLRWADPQLASLADDGLAIDDVRFSAVSTVPEPTGLALLALGAVGLAGGRRRVR